MPKKYEKIRDKMKRQGMPAKEAKARAARIYNSQRGPKQAPVTRNYKRTVAKQAAKTRARKKRARRSS